ncbi:MAG TPA: hypothetical protein VF719_01200, partial [Abditibacteriaceae bacterium]
MRQWLTVAVLCVLSGFTLGTGTARAQSSSDGVLTIAKTAPAVAVTGSTFSYNIRVTNLSKSSISKVRVSDVLPSTTTFVSQSVTPPTGVSFTS